MSVKPISDQQAVVAASPLSEQAQGALASANAKYAALIAQGVQPSLEGMPGEILSHITSYLPYIVGHQGVRDPRQFLSQVNRKWRVTITNQMVQQFEGHPDIARLLKYSSWLSNASDAHKIGLIAYYLWHSINVLLECMSLKIRDADRDFRTIDLIDMYSEKEAFKRRIKSHQDAFHGYLQDQRIRLRYFDRRSFHRTPSSSVDILLNAIILKDANYLRTVAWEYQPFDDVDRCCYLSLLIGEREVFDAALPHSSVHASNDLPIITSAMSWLLGLAAMDDDIELFQKLLGYKKPYLINGLLCALAGLNCPKCMAHLLTLEGINPNAFVAALRRAVLHDRQNVVLVMLQARPGREISREGLRLSLDTLTQLEELARQDERGLPPATVQILQFRRRLDPHGEGARAMIHVLTQEIANRYPVEERVVEEVVLPAQAIAQAEAVLLQGHEQAIPQAQEILLQALARAHVARAQAQAMPAQAEAAPEQVQQAMPAQAEAAPEQVQQAMPAQAEAAPEQVQQAMPAQAEAAPEQVQQAMPAQAEAAPEQARAAPTFSRWMLGIAVPYMLYRSIRAVSSNR